MDDTKTTTESHDEPLAELAATTPCPKGHACIKSQFQQMGQVDPAAGGQVLFCQGEGCWLCPQRMAFGRSGLCQCPIRRYVAMYLGK